ncbi:hypothetical protein M9Y10_023443 [Tritrichomonas musculus]|uniref:Serine/threonine-protein phosphatase n=1 Tax=Tritrichomonas musculus TaxID=1915356 RepID=A0ABR2KVB2_9EUKA
MFASNYVALNTVNLILQYNINKLHNKITSHILAKESDVISVISQATSLLKLDASILSLEGNFKVIGDIHGNLPALIRFFNKYGYPPHSYFLFLGDYVDRGSNSVEVLLLLYSLKILFPNHIYLLRGNHECESLTTQYEFRKECETAFSKKVYYKIIESFNSLPIAAILNKDIFCVHGGISPSLKSRNDLFLLVKKTDKEPTSGVVGDLLWSDFEEFTEGFETSERGCGYVCGKDAVANFLKNCGFSLILRSHQECDQGYLWPFGKDGHCLTIFGCPDYMGTVNDAAVAVVNQNDEIMCEVFHPLFNSQMKKIRTILPEWILAFESNELNSKRDYININDPFNKIENRLMPERTISEPYIEPLNI